jgi:hypothetical protein
MNLAHASETAYFSCASTVAVDLCAQALEIKESDSMSTLLFFSAGMLLEVAILDGMDEGERKQTAREQDV